MKSEGAAKRRSRFDPGEHIGTAKVLIADPDPLARRVIRGALESGGRFDVAAEASTADEAIELARSERPDVALIELIPTGNDGMSLTGLLIEAVPELKVLIVSREESREGQVKELIMGASGFVPKTAELSTLTDAVDAVLRGEMVVPPRTMMHVLELLRQMPAGGSGMRPIASPLTQREWEILDLMSQGMNTHQMAEALVLAEETIYSHVKNVLRKLNVHSRDEAVKAAQAMRTPKASVTEAAVPGRTPSTNGAS